MQIIDKTVFQELAYNNPRDALFALYAEAERAERERGALVASLAVALDEVQAHQTEIFALQDQVKALQETVAALFEAVNAPVEA